MNRRSAERVGVEAPTYNDLLEKVRDLERETEKRKRAEQFSKTVLNSLSAHIAIIDEDGSILETNEAWKNFATSNDISARPDMIGVNYLKLCEGAEGDSADEAGDVARGIRSVIAGETEEFVIDYPCHSPGQKRWFYMRARRMAGPGPVRVVVSHENITALKLAEEELKQQEAELLRKTRHLDEANTALRVLLKQREADKAELEEKVLANARDLILPYVERLRETRLGDRQREYIDQIDAHLNEIISPFLHRIYAQYRDLTPQEIRVATMIKSGRTTKEIAASLGVSQSAVEFHRKNIRRKFGISHKRANLRSHLLSLEER